MLRFKFRKRNIYTKYIQEFILKDKIINKI